MIERSSVRRGLALVLCLALSLTLAACQMPEAEQPPVVNEGKKTNSLATVYFLNPDTELDEQWQALAALYTQQTGYRVTVVSPEQGEYEAVLTAEMPKIEAPTLFAVSSPARLEKWADRCWDLSGYKITDELAVPSLALERGEAVLALPYSVQAYGLLANGGLLEQAGHFPGEINSLEQLRAVTEDMTARKEELGFSAFASMGLSQAGTPGPAAMLANVPLWLANTGGEHADEFKAVWDLYTTNSTCEPSVLADRSAGEGLKEFTSGQAAFYLSGSWEYDDVLAVMPEADLTVLPVFVGAGSESDQGLCLGVSGYWCVNTEADINDIEVTMDFIYWCVHSPEGIAAMTEMGYVLPYQSVPASDNLFISRALTTAAEGKILVTWAFSDAPEGWEEELNSAVAAYATGGKWESVAPVFAKSAPVES